MFSYGGQHEDELCFETGDIITLISKVRTIKYHWPKNFNIIYFLWVVWD